MEEVEGIRIVAELLLVSIAGSGTKGAGAGECIVVDASGGIVETGVDCIASDVEDVMEVVVDGCSEADVGIVLVVVVVTVVVVVVGV